MPLLLFAKFDRNFELPFEIVFLVSNIFNGNLLKIKLFAGVKNFVVNSITSLNIYSDRLINSSLQLTFELNLYKWLTLTIFNII